MDVDIDSEFFLDDFLKIGSFIFLFLLKKSITLLLQMKFMF